MSEIVPADAEQYLDLGRIADAGDASRKALAVQLFEASQEEVRFRLGQLER